MIANNENGRPPFDGTPVVIATAGRGAVNHYLEDSPFLEAVEARHVDDLPLVCPCNNEPWPCADCKRENAERATLSRLRRLRESDGNATDGEPRDTGDDLC